MSDEEEAAPPDAGEEKSYYRQFPDWLNWIVYVMTQTMTLIAAKLWLRVRVLGKKNVPASGPVMLVCNHSSHLDPPLCCLTTRRHICYLGKSDLFEKRFLGTYISMLGAFPIRRGEADRQAIRACVKMLREGKVLLIFPEGTRSPDGKLREAKTGTAMILSQVPETTIVPVRIDGSWEAFGKGEHRIRPGKVTINIGKSFRLGDLATTTKAKKQLYHEIGEQIMHKISDATA